MDELKTQLKSLYEQLDTKQIEVFDLTQLILKTKNELQQQCFHKSIIKHCDYDGHKSYYYYICQDCDKKLLY